MPTNYILNKSTDTRIELLKKKKKKKVLEITPDKITGLFKREKKKKKQKWNLPIGQRTKRPIFNTPKGVARP